MFFWHKSGYNGHYVQHKKLNLVMAFVSFVQKFLSFEDFSDVRNWMSDILFFS